MSSDSPTPEKPPAEPVKPSNHSKVYWISGIVIVLLIAIGIFYTNRSSDKIVSEPVKKKEPVFHRDEPTEKQIFQEDYRAKVREMLDSGKSPMEISKETKIRIDEVRKIKKEYKKEKGG